MKIILAPDSFKGSLTAIEAANAMALGIRDYNPSICTILLPAADGGEGTMKSLVNVTDGKMISVSVQDPIGRKIKARYGILGDGETCVIEIAEASGLMLLDTNERDVLKASSYGTGELIEHALSAGFRKFIIGLGGSATNDGGAGILKALGMRFLDEEGMELSMGGGAFGNLYEIDVMDFDKRISECEFVIACDVENPFIGPEGASTVFGPQKGASPDVVEQLDMNLKKFADIIQTLTGISIHQKKGAGAAGGAGGAFQAFFQCEMRPGIDVILNAISFEEHVKNADLILTGEGKSDAQTLSGKTPFGIAKVAQREGKPVILISGAIDEGSRMLLTPLFNEIHALTNGSVSKEQSITNAFHYLQRETRLVIENYMSSNHN